MFFNGAMTLVYRNGLLFLFLVVAALVVLAYVGAAFLWFPENPAWLYLEFAPGLAVSVAGLVWFRRQYRKTNATTVFFLAVFAFCGLGDILRLTELFLVMDGQPYATGVLLTRLVWTFRLVAVFSLFLACLYQLEFPYPKYGNLVALSVGAAVLLAASLPVQTARLGTDGLYPLGDVWGVSLVIGGFLVMGAVNLGLAWWTARRDYSPTGKALLVLRVWGFLAVGWLLGVTVHPTLSVLCLPGILLLDRTARELLT